METNKINKWLISANGQSYYFGKQKMTNLYKHISYMYKIEQSQRSDQIYPYILHAISFMNVMIKNTNSNVLNMTISPFQKVLFHTFSHIYLKQNKIRHLLIKLHKKPWYLAIVCTIYNWILNMTLSMKQVLKKRQTAGRVYFTKMWKCYFPINALTKG